MKAIRRTLAYQRLRARGPWRLLVLDNAPIALGLLQTHLFDGERRLPVSILVERLEQDLVALRLEGIDMPQPAQAYLAQWLNSGYLERSYPEGAGEEEYELSTAAVQAIRFVQGLEQERAVATESRLSMVLQQMRQLAEQTETDPQRRIDALLRERERIDAQIQAVREGRLRPLSDEQAVERTREIIALADELGADFRRVRDQFQRLNHDLRERIVDNDEHRGEVLEALFAGVDLIAESEAGRSFKAFWRLLTDPEQSASLDEALEQIMERDFSRHLERRERRFLLGLLRDLLERGGEVHEVSQRFARGLRQFVQSQEFREQRRINRLLKLAQRRALAIKDAIRPQTDLGRELHLTSAAIRSLSQFQLHDPSLDRVEGGIRQAAEAEISLDSIRELVTHSEIDFRTLEDHVHTALEEVDPISIGELLERFPAEQGLGSVVGYLALGVRDGVLSDQRERVQWRGLDGVERSAWIPKVFFVRERGRA